jgi:tetratricopeptide (TPR) repeat protein
LTLLFAAMAMMSKSSTVILPVVLCLCAWWQEGRWQWRKMASVAPIFLISLATAAVSVWTQRLQLAIDKGSEWARGWPERLATAGDAVWFYLGKLLWPHPLMTVYPHWAIGTGQSFSFLSLVLVMGVLLILWLKRDSWSRPWFFVFAYFLVALLPALGLVDNTIFRYSLVFDHFQYLASMGPLALAGAGLVWASGFVLPKGPWLQPSLCAGLLLLLGTLSWQRARVYESQETLWTDALAKNPDCWEGYNNLGDALLQSGRIDEAMAQIQKALAINHQNAETHYNLGNVYKQMGRVDEAISEYQKALAINPDLASAPSNLGIALALKGRLDEAIIQFQKALEINPNFADAHNNLGNAYLRKGQVDEAIPEFQKALEIKPDYAEAHSNLARALSQKGQSDEALAEYDKSQKIDPDHVVGSLGLGLALLQKGRVDEAMIQFQQILEIDPNNALAHNNLGWALFLKGQVDEAIPEYQKALEIDPTYVGAYNNLGWAYLQAKGQPDNAIIQFQKALAIDPNYALAHTNLGSALFQKGKYAEAAAQFQDILRQNPNDADAQSNLAKMQALVRQPSASK